MEAIVCLWEKAWAFLLLEVSCLVWGRLALPAVEEDLFFTSIPTTLLAFVLPTFESSNFHPVF